MKDFHNIEQRHLAPGRRFGWNKYGTEYFIERDANGWTAKSRHPSMYGRQTIRAKTLAQMSEKLANPAPFDPKKDRIIELSRPIVEGMLDQWLDSIYPIPRICGLQFIASYALKRTSPFEYEESMKSFCKRYGIQIEE